MAKHYSAALRTQIWLRSEGCCAYCLSQEEHASEPFSIDHIVPVFAGGGDEIENLALCCNGCNGFKHAKTQAIDPETGEMTALFHPFFDKRSAHFEWNQSFTMLVGLTPKGRATVLALKLNRPILVNRRQLFGSVGFHPPTFFDSK